MSDTKINTIGDYIAQAPAPTQPLLQHIRQLVKEIAPEVTELISYKMPTFELGKNRFYLAAYKKHIGVYAIYENDSPWEADFAPYRTTKDTLQFTLTEPLPIEVIRKAIRYKLLS